ncbi:DEAD/DEAH box helicase [Vibrio genomosp. F10]|uniref:DEAD/DEAH box helicase n=1 Tax=Vibrio genomosp. F10 TaxID=723171 RepID=UPI0002F76F20|nr:DEAD/DEAH box helicase [Vibrio genomosp. F10]OEF07310.1 DEAD/DEAH box helicase [Vibrio genomosp. F10 str. 9ZB36]
MPFSRLTLSSTLIHALPSSFRAPTDIQSQAIPIALKGGDLLAIAQTGSGKTLAYGLPIIEKVLEINAHNALLPSATIVVPTRELAAQVTTELQLIATNIAQLDQTQSVKIVSVCGGIEKEIQIEQLQPLPHIIVATPGRLLDLIQSRHLDVSGIHSVVFDEADRLLDMGFWSNIQAISHALPNNRQTMMFSATLPDELKERLNTQLKQPSYVQVTLANQVADNIEERLFLVNKGSKAKALIQQIHSEGWQQVLVFIGAKDNADALTKKLTKAGIDCAALHGNKTQQEREYTLDQFKNKSIQVLIATDLLARGIHIDHLPVVINFELPSDPMAYVHRVGRTARAGQQGLAVSLVCHGEADYLHAIRQCTHRPLITQTLADFPVTDKPSSSGSKRAPRDKKANRRTNNKKSIKQFQQRSSKLRSRDGQ